MSFAMPDGLRVSVVPALDQSEEGRPATRVRIREEVRT